MNQEKIDIVITSNSPGEIYSFVKPVVKSIKEKIPSARIILVVMPCQFAGGREIEVARTFPEIYEIIFPEEFNAWMFRNTPPKGITFSKKGILLFLGGDLFQAASLAKKLDYKAAAYINDRFGWKKHYAEFFVADDRMAKKALKKKIPTNKIRIVGDLMADGQRDPASKEKWGLDNNRPVITFMPGSRPNHARHMASFFIRAAELIAQRTQAQFVFGLSPYISIVALEKYISGNEDNYFIKHGLGSRARLINENGLRYILSESGLKILVIDTSPYEAMDVSDLILTIPGTNTAEAASMGKPMIVLLPLNKTDVLLFEGFIGLAGNIPFIGAGIKKLAAFILNRTIMFMALPNIKAGRFIVPELRGILTPAQAAEKAVEMLSDKEKLVETGKQLKAVMGGPGAADKIAEEIAHILNIS
jgi:lipid-A-disaccharide synthase